MEEPLVGSGQISFERSVRHLFEQAQARRRRSWLKSCCPQPTGRVARTCMVFSYLAISSLLVVSPNALATAQCIAMLLVYFFALPTAITSKARWQRWHYDFSTSAEDLCLLAVVRLSAVLVAYRAVPGLVYRRTYLVAVLCMATFEIPFASIKLGAIRNAEVSGHTKVPLMVLSGLSIAFATLHVAAARGALAWARRRAQLGLVSPSGEENEPYETLYPHDIERGVQQNSAQLNFGYPPADPNSRFFADLSPSGWQSPDVTVHYKLAIPRRSAADAGIDASVPIGIVLIHGFGGGLHSWRHVMQPLADSSGFLVVAFDRPGFGLTSRPPEPQSGPSERNPYSPSFSANLCIRLASFLSLRRIILLGASDGALIALMAAATLRQNEQTLLRSSSTTQPSPTSMISPSPGQSNHDAHPSPSGSMSESYDLSWMGSAAPTNRREILKRLMTGQHAFGSTTQRIPEESEQRAIEIQQAEEIRSPTQTQAEQDDLAPGESALSFGFDEAFVYPAMEDDDLRDTAMSPDMHDTSVQAHTSPAVARDAETLPSVAGIVLLHPDLTGASGPPHMAVLAASKVGRATLSGLLRHEIGEVGSRHSWASRSPPADVLALYRRRLRGPGWEEGLLAAAKAVSSRLSKKKLRELTDMACEGQQAPAVLVIEGSTDETRQQPPYGRLEVVEGAARVSFEEQPVILTSIISSFAAQLR